MPEKPAIGGPFSRQKENSLTATLAGWRCSADRTRLRAKYLLTGNFTGKFSKSTLGTPPICEKPICSSDFLRNSLPQISGKPSLRTAILPRGSGKRRWKRRRSHNRPKAAFPCPPPAGYVAPIPLLTITVKGIDSQVADFRISAFPKSVIADSDGPAAPPSCSRAFAVFPFPLHLPVPRDTIRKPPRSSSRSKRRRRSG
jgi:hypothetical protein